MSAPNEENPREETRRAVFRAASYLGFYGPFPLDRVELNEYGEPCYPLRDAHGGAEVVYDMYRGWVFS